MISYFDPGLFSTAACQDILQALRQKNNYMRGIYCGYMHVVRLMANYILTCYSVMCLQKDTLCAQRI